MLKSTHCVLHAKTDKELTDLGECPYDQGGYFVVTGSEKVLIAQERMCNNHVYVFPPVSGSEVRVAEIRSQPEGASRPAQALYVKLLRAPKSVGVTHRALQLIGVMAYPNVQLMFGSLGLPRAVDRVWASSSRHHPVHSTGHPYHHRVPCAQHRAGS